MSSVPRPAACERARVWAALLPDDELSLFERRLLDAHCLHCPECRHALASVSELTGIIRATPLETMDRQVRVIRPRPAYWQSASGVLATAAAAALALALAFWVGPERTQPRQAPTASTPVIVVTQQSPAGDVQGIWQLKRARTGASSGEVATHHTGAILT